jgi:hypothetical protein
VAANNVDTTKGALGTSDLDTQFSEALSPLGAVTIVDSWLVIE